MINYNIQRYIYTNEVDSDINYYLDYKKYNINIGEY